MSKRDTFPRFCRRESAQILGGGETIKEGLGLYPGEGRGGGCGTQFKSRYLFIHLTLSGHARPLKLCTLELKLKESQELNCSCGMAFVRTWGLVVDDCEVLMSMRVTWEVTMRKWVILEAMMTVWGSVKWWWACWWFSKHCVSDLRSDDENVSDFGSNTCYSSCSCHKQDLQYSAPTHPITLNTLVVMLAESKD